ncbi:hypothetical protein [Thioclava pacifica]|uniref:Uncharacterized protein n=1 Tax=Thioclava pacifica DSM 10166 TaxID=1353537 RepID=A0A074JAG4_9RHOB|nr:hypothetical protein [Thioclava pacifica]KEO52835.1 hypothetical protein TP2_07805 [Thioclava pacifica DSM 10166]
MQTQAMQIFAAMTALAICYRERRGFAQVFEEIKARRSDRSIVDRMVWGTGQRKLQTPPADHREPPVSRKEPLVDRLMEEVARREKTDEAHRNFSGVSISRVARATIRSNGRDDTLL